HTRCLSDWSSDVCSSDLEPILGAKRAAKPLAAFLTPQAERSLVLLAEQGIAAFRTPEACADAFAAYFSWRAPRQREAAEVPYPQIGRASCRERVEIASVV